MTCIIRRAAVKLYASYHNRLNPHERIMSTRPAEWTGFEKEKGRGLECPIQELKSQDGSILLRLKYSCEQNDNAMGIVHMVDMVA